MEDHVEVLERLLTEEKLIWGMGFSDVGKVLGAVGGLRKKRRIASEENEKMEDVERGSYQMGLENN